MVVMQNSPTSSLHQPLLKLEEQLTCPVCLDSFMHALILGHYLVYSLNELDYYMCNVHVHVDGVLQDTKACSNVWTSRWCIRMICKRYPQLSMGGKRKRNE